MGKVCTVRHSEGLSHKGEDVFISAAFSVFRFEKKGSVFKPRRHVSARLSGVKQETTFFAVSVLSVYFLLQHNALNATRYIFNTQFKDLTKPSEALHFIGPWLRPAYRRRVLWLACSRRLADLWGRNEDITFSSGALSSPPLFSCSLRGERLSRRNPPENILSLPPAIGRMCLCQCRLLCKRRKRNRACVGLVFACVRVCLCL